MQPITFFSSGRDRGLVLLLEWFDPFHAMWVATNGGQPIVLAEDGVHTLH